MRRVLAALSGGVDSAVAAAMAVAAGHEVVGVHLGLARDLPAALAGGCGTPDDLRDAQQVADGLGIPLQVWDLSATFTQTVVAHFCDEYAAGRTPNPCVFCNQHMKFATLLDHAAERGFDVVCTGHYAQVDRHGSLRRAVCQAKDQSYVLAAVGPQRLARALFPLGALPDKDAVRARAVALGLSVADKPDSLDLCFIPDGDTQGFLTRRLGPQPGDIVDLDGAVLGRHDGTYRFTIGQRRGLALENPAPDGRPRYVVSLDPAARRVVVGPVEALDVTGLVTSTPVWYVPPAAHDCLVQVRAHATPVPGTVTPTDTGLTIRLRTPLRGVAAGQSAVCYDGDRVLAQGAITSTARGEPPSRVD